MDDELVGRRAVGEVYVVDGGGERGEGGEAEAAREGDGAVGGADVRVCALLRSGRGEAPAW